MMTLRQELIAKLVKTCHLNVEERDQLGSPFLEKDEIVSAIKKILDSDRFFPSHARPWIPGSNVYEGFFIEMRDSGYVVHWQRHLPLNPCALAESFNTHYRSSDQAIRALIKEEYPSDIDGIPIK